MSRFHRLNFLRGTKKKLCLKSRRRIRPHIFFGRVEGPQQLRQLDDMIAPCGTIAAITALKAPTLLRADGRNFAGDSSADGCWRENCAGNHEGEYHTEKSKDKAVVGAVGVVGALEISFFIAVVE